MKEDEYFSNYSFRHLSKPDHLEKQFGCKSKKVELEAEEPHHKKDIMVQITMEV